jgi:hypothetical protein
VRGAILRDAARRAAPQDEGFARGTDAIFLKHSRHRQSPPSTGIGSRIVSSAHQHGPDRLQVNSTPHPEQARRREAGVASSSRVVMDEIGF